MSVRLVGANPGMTVREGDQLLAFASVWRVDWSERGAGLALVLWHAGTTQVVSASPALGGWLAEEFTRHFPEVRGQQWPDPLVVEAPVAWEQDLGVGLRASAADVTVEITGPKDRRLVRDEAFDLGGSSHLLSTVYMPCAVGTLTVAGVPVTGDVHAYLADAEVWCA
ncbi:MAG: hypothetical protein HOU81_16100 [Hamadaea sp.]|uniref:hypothetical protein n=1 Tax=Hamadaea sp. TaxID=2024425 RepID=UPI0018157944|nr:hypothetical protein [Hamadaea sp.]NUR72337.1 hypothetical protein [Hamadaea sp.]NUT18444.1 hypothetical protein [Hamadaea sp.]